MRDINEYEMFPGQKKLLKSTGQPYEEVGRVRVLDTRSKTAVAQVEYSCDPINPGDTAIPFAEKQMVPFHAPLRFDRFLPTGSKVSGRIVMGRDFDSELGTGQKVYFLSLIHILLLTVRLRSSGIGVAIQFLQHRFRSRFLGLKFADRPLIR